MTAAEPPQPPLHAATGVFVDRELESEYQRANLDEHRRFLRFSLSIATLAFLSYGVHDVLVVPEVKSTALAVRYGVFVPIAAATFALVGSRHLVRFGQLAMLAYGTAASFVVLFIAAIAPVHGFYLYSSYAVVFVTLGPFAARMNVVTEGLYTLITFALYNVLDAIYVRSPMPVRASISATLLALGAIGSLIAYRLERASRALFLQRRTVAEKAVALDAEKRRSEELLLNVLPAEIAERLKRESRAIAEGFDEVSVLFADIVGFTKMSERLSPQELVERLNQMFSSFDDLCDKLRLEKIKTIGDSYMVAGGLHSREYNHAEAIAEMALAMRRRFADFSARFGEPLDIRIGIHTGPVVAGVIGKRKFSYDVWGDTVNTAARMESHAEPGKIHVSESMQALLKGRYELTFRGEIEIKGKGPMRTYWLIDRVPDSLGRRPGKTHIPRKVRS